jgi:hypothetical protein
MSPRDPLPRQTSRDRPVETDLEQLLTKTKQMNDIGNIIYWSQRPFLTSV